MRIIKTLAAAAALAVTGSAAMAWGDMYMGDGTSGAPMLLHSYKGANYCPAGLQPIQVGGVICCGVPTAGAYIDRPGGKRKAVHQPAKRVHHAPRAYAPEGTKGVVYR